MKTQTKMALMAGVTMLSLSIPLTLSTAFAQSQKATETVTKDAQAPEQGGPPPGGFGGVQGGPPMAGPQGGRGQGGMGGGMAMPPGGGMMGGGMMGGGGGTAMVADGSSLYIVQGNRVFKLSKDDLKVVASGELPRPQGQPNPQRAGGQGGPPPPPAESGK